MQNINQFVYFHDTYPDSGKEASMVQYLQGDMQMFCCQESITITIPTFFVYCKVLIFFFNLKENANIRETLVKLSEIPVACQGCTSGQSTRLTLKNREEVLNVNDPLMFSKVKLVIGCLSVLIKYLHRFSIYEHIYKFTNQIIQDQVAVCTITHSGIFIHPELDLLCTDQRSGQQATKSFSFFFKKLYSTPACRFLLCVV